MIYSISDLHLGSSVDKPMDVFGAKWEGHFEKIKSDWLQKVKEDDVVLLAGDLSWAMTLEEVKPDLRALAELPGQKVILKGNHDYWWQSLSKVRGVLPQGIYALQNDVIRIGKYLICGTRGWTAEHEKEEDKKIFDRELIRLELSLTAMSKVREEGDIVIGMTHYPPFDVSLQPTPVTDLFTKYGVEQVVYGHLHGNAYAKKKVYLNRTTYYLTSCDLVDFTLVSIAD